MNKDKVNEEGYFFIGLGQKYINECFNLALTIKKQKDYRQIGILINEEDYEYTKSKNIFNHFVIFKSFDDDIRPLCKNYFEKNCLYPRLYLPEYTPFNKSIILDSDILCQSNPESIWEYVKQKEYPVQMTGFIDDRNWQCGKINEVEKAFGKHIPCVHGGFFYINKKNYKTQEFFKFCRSLIFKYDEYKCPRGYPNFMVDEILFAITHSEFNISPIEFTEYPIITFNYTKDITIPSNIQTCTKNNNPISLKNYIPFIHMFDKLHGENYNYILQQILNHE